MSGGKIFLILTGVLLCCGLARECRDENINDLKYERKQLVDTIVYVDTIKYYKFIPRDSTVVRYITMRLPLAPTGHETHCDSAEGKIPTDTLHYRAGIASADSALISLPIISRHYSDSTYEAWISGAIAPRLDSLRIYPRREILRIKDPPKHWGIGLTAGYGYGPRGGGPYLGIGLTYSIILF